MKYIVYLTTNTINNKIYIGVTLVKIFNTVREARKEFSNVGKVLRGQATHYHNFIFKYEE